MKKLLLILAIVILSGCDTGFRQMGATEYGLRFRRLPPIFGGGVSSEVISPGQMALVWPWDQIYRFNTAVQDISWGPAETEEGETSPDFVYTRALDGNEVALAVNVGYKVSSAPEDLLRLVDEVATNDREVRLLVESISRADIRTYMNELRTSEFLAKESRYKAVDRVKESIHKRLQPYGIEVVRVNLNNFQFERLRPDGTIDSSYQDKLKEIQRIREGVDRERSRIETIRAKKQQELNEAQAWVNQEVEKAEGHKNQAKFRGDSYLQAHENQAKGILAKGKAEVEGMKEQIQAMSGPGGKAILKLDIARALLKGDPRFVVMGEGQKTNGISVNKVDENSIIDQIGMLEAYKDKKEK